MFRSRGEIVEDAPNPCKICRNQIELSNPEKTCRPCQERLRSGWTEEQIRNLICEDCGEFGALCECTVGAATEKELAECAAGRHELKAEENVGPDSGTEEIYCARCGASSREIIYY